MRITVFSDPCYHGVFVYSIVAIAEKKNTDARLPSALYGTHFLTFF